MKTDSFRANSGVRLAQPWTLNEKTMSGSTADNVKLLFRRVKHVAKHISRSTDSYHEDTKLTKILYFGLCALRVFAIISFKPLPGVT